MAEELWKTDVDLTAVLDQQTMTLGEIFNLKVGSQIPLNATPQSLVDVRCGDISMFKGNMGRRGDNIAVRIFEKIISKERSNGS